MLRKYVSVKKITKYQLKFNGKPWITSGIQKSISIKNRHLEKLIRKKDPQINAEFHEKYKTCKSCTLMKKNKQTCYTECFESNWNNIKNNWQGIETIISIKCITTSILHSFEFKNRTITGPTAMSNTFKYYFISLTQKTKSNIKFLSKDYTDYLIQTQVCFY